MKFINKFNIVKIAILLIFFSSFNIYALKFLPKVGLTHSNVSMNDKEPKNHEYSQPEYKLGKILSLELQVNLEDDFYFNFGLTLNQKGFIEVFSNNSKKSIDIYAFNIPFMLDYKINKYMEFYLGIYLGLSSYMELEQGGFIGGVINYKNFLIDFRFEQGSGYVLKRSIEDETGVYFENGRQFILMLGYQFF